MRRLHAPGLGGRSCMLLSTSLFALSGLFGVRALEIAGPWLALACRFGIPLLALSLAAGSRTMGTLLQTRAVHLVRAACLVASQATFLLCASASGLFVAIVLCNTGPMLLVLIEAVYRRRWPSWRALACCGLGLFGVWTIQGSGFPAGLPALALGMGSGVLYALSQFTLFLASSEEAGSTVLLQTFFWASLLCLVPAVCTTPGSTLLRLMGSPQLGISLVLAGLCSLGNQWFRSLAYQRTPRLSSLAPLLYFGIVVALGLDILRSGNTPSTPQLFGTACIVASALGARRVERPGRSVQAPLRNRLE